MAGGIMGKMTRNIPIVVILVLLGSLIESLFILPSHLNRSKALRNTNGSGPKREKWMARKLRQFIDGPYAKFIEFALHWRYATVAAGFAVLLITLGIWQAGYIKFTFFPKIESDTLECLITMPAGTPPERTYEVVTHLETAARAVLDEIDEKQPAGAPSNFEYSISLVGGQFGRHSADDEIGGHLAQIWIQLLESERRDMSSNEVIALWRKNAGIVADAETINFKSDIHSAGNAIEIHLSMDDHDQLLLAADELKAEIEKYPGVFDVGDSFLPGKTGNAD